MMCGGPSEVKNVNEEINTLCTEIKNDLETKADRAFNQFKPIKYKSQVVAGTNYFVKIQVDDAEYFHVRLFKPLPHTGDKVQLVAYQDRKIFEDSIEPF